MSSCSIPAIHRLVAASRLAPSRYLCPVFAVLALALVLFGSSDALAKKAGYEFFDKAHGETKLAVNLLVYDLLAIAPNANWIVPQGGGKPEFRAIDIVIEKGSPDPFDWRFSAVLLKNSGDYKRSSLLLWDLTEQEVKELEQLQNVVALDIEHVWYKDRHGDYVKRYAIVLADNPENHQWTVVMDAKKGDLTDLALDNFRPIDLDAFDDTLWPWGVPEASYLRYDGVFVDNSKGNDVPTVSGFMTEQNIESLYYSGFHVIDVQGVPTNYVPYLEDEDMHWHVIMVQTNNSWWTDFFDATEIHEILQDKPGQRLIDLKPYGSDQFRATFLPQSK